VSRKRGYRIFNSWPLPILCPIFLVLGCFRHNEKQPPLNEGFKIQAIYFESEHIGDGIQEKNLYLGCMEQTIAIPKFIDTVSSQGQVRLVIPCYILNNINDSLTSADSILGHDERFYEIWKFNRYSQSDSGIVSTKKCSLLRMARNTFGG
jgi:hypothetical protein